MEKLIKCSCGTNRLPVHSYKFGCHHIECDFCEKESNGASSPEIAIQIWNDMMREEYLKVEPNDKDKLYAQEFKTKEHKGHLCDTCKHQIRGMANGCRAGIHELGLVWQCMNYEYYGPSAEDIDEALNDAGNTKQVGGDHCENCEYGNNEFKKCVRTNMPFADKVECKHYKLVKHQKNELYGEYFKSKQVGGDHYSRHKIQPWDIIDEYELGFYEGTALKYLLRRKVDRLEDIKKCVHTLEKLITNMEDKL